MKLIKLSVEHQYHVRFIWIRHIRYKL